MTRKIYRPRKMMAPSATDVELELETSPVAPRKSFHVVELVKSPSMESSGTSDTCTEDSGHSLDHFAHLSESFKKERPDSVRIKKSILKPVQNVEELAIKEKSRSWKALPKPDMGQIRRKSLRSADDVDVPRRLVRRSSSVGFGDISIREYSQTIGDNPSCSYGPPIALDWEFEEKEGMKLDDYEQARAPRRALREMCMNYYQRKNRLMALYGHSEEEIKQAKRDLERMQRQRAVTKAFLPMSMLEDAIQSAARKTKRLTGGNVRNASV